MLSNLKYYPNSVNVMICLLESLHIKVSSYTAKKVLISHPDFPSMLAFTDSLAEWNISNGAFKVNKHTVDFTKLQYPFVAHLPEDDGYFLLVNEVIGDVLKCQDKTGNSFDFIISDFVRNWEGTIVFARKEPESGEKYYIQSVFRGIIEQVRFPSLIIAIVLFISLSIDYKDSNNFYLSLLVIKFAGIAVCGLLLIYALNSRNPFISNLCTFGNKNGCNAILKSKGSQLTTWLSWGEVGMFYFAGSFILLLVHPGSNSFLAILNLLCLPYTIYSIGYQIKLRSWCILCCSVQVLLWAEAILFYCEEPFWTSTFTFQYSPLAYSILSFALPVLLWMVIKPVLLKSLKSDYFEEYLKRFKNNSQIFNKILTSQKFYLIPDDLFPIRLGNPSAPDTILMVSNPFCGPCSDAHVKIHRLVNLRDDIQMQVIFTTASRDGDPLTEVARHLINLSLSADAQFMAEALEEWYVSNTKNGYEAWKTKYPIKEEQMPISIIEKHKNWCRDAQIMFTPTIFVNGYKLPSTYTIDDLEYLL